MALLRGYRLRRGPALALLVLVGVVGSAVILATQLRPSLEVYDAVTVDSASVGTTYAVDDQVCVRAAQVGATLQRVEIGGDGGGLVLRVAVPPEDAAPVIAFPVEALADPEVSDVRAPADSSLCLRLLVSAGEQGEYRAPEITAKLRYGPGGLFRRSLTVRPPTTLQVVRTGPDPRLAPEE